MNDGSAFDYFFDELDSTFAPQYIFDTNIFRLTFNRVINCGISNPEIFYLDVLQKRRQDWL